MKTFEQTVILTLAAACLVILPPAASAQISKEFSNSKIVLQEYKKGDGGYWAYALGDSDDPDKSKRGVHPMDPKRAGVPVFGREEDAADQMEAFLALQFGSDIARTIIKADAYYYEWSATVEKSDPATFAEFADVHGTDRQRVYNLLCMAYGGQREAFQDMVDSGWLPQERAQSCESEYRRAEAAFRKTIVPFIDPAQMKKVQARQGWFQPAELKDK